jgi:hypothetical protein
MATLRSKKYHQQHEEGTLMKRLIPVLFLLLPVVLFAQDAQSPKDRESAMLKKWGLNDSQSAQVFDIQKSTMMTMRQDFVQMRLLRAQMAKALLPASPNMQEVNGYITQIAQTRADMMKAFVGARVQLRQIIGDDNFPAYSRFIMRMHKHWFGHYRSFHRMDLQRPAGSMNGGDGPMMGDADDSDAQTD